MIEISRRLAGRGPRPAHVHRTIHVRALSPSAFILRFTREALLFQPGQWINVGIAGSREQREYSIYSGIAEDFLEVLVKEIPDGIVSRALRRCAPGDPLEVEGPNGAFTLVEGTRDPSRFLFCATGTGISPFHCFTRSKSNLDYQLLHGVRTGVETYEHAAYDDMRLIPCISRGVGAGTYYRGRLTSYLKQKPVSPDAYCYLCGNSDMIYEAYSILKRYGITRSRIYAEVYF